MTISSPLATQIPQAAGVAYTLKRDQKRRDNNCAIVYFGEGMPLMEEFFDREMGAQISVISKEPPPKATFMLV